LTAADVDAAHPRALASIRTVYKSAACIVPPEAVWGPIQAIRRDHDRGFVRWLPHINLLYGFIPDELDNFARAAEALQAALSTVPPFRVRLAQFGYFQVSTRCQAMDGVAGRHLHNHVQRSSRLLLVARLAAARQEELHRVAVPRYAPSPGGAAPPVVHAGRLPAGGRGEPVFDDGIQAAPVGWPVAGPQAGRCGAAGPAGVLAAHRV